VTNVAIWKRQGAIRPIPATQALWDALRDAKVKGDRKQVCALTEDIRKKTIDAEKERR
jgi:hypothetical protein